MSDGCGVSRIGQPRSFVSALPFGTHEEPLPSGHVAKACLPARPPARYDVCSVSRKTVNRSLSGVSALLFGAYKDMILSRLVALSVRAYLPACGLPACACLLTRPRDVVSWRSLGRPEGVSLPCVACAPPPFLTPGMLTALNDIAFPYISAGPTRPR